MVGVSFARAVFELHVLDHAAAIGAAGVIIVASVIVAAGVTGAAGVI